MPFTRIWDNALPLGSTAANQIDDLFRNTKVDITERMDSLLGIGKWISDPIATFTGKKVVIPCCAGFKARDPGQYIVANPNGVGLDATGITTNISIFVPVVLPKGVVITDISVRSDYINTGLILSAHIYGGNARLTSAPDVLTAGSGVLTAITIPTGPFTFLDSINYFVEVNFASTVNFAVGYAREIVITYDKANILQAF